MSAPSGDRPRYNLIGQRIPLIDAAKKVTGEGEYPEDLALPGMLFARILRSPHAHARIVAIDPSAALALPGVRGFVRGTDAPGKFGVLPITQDETAMAVDRVRYVGDCVAAIAADDQETADAAVRLIRVEYQPLPPILRAEQALRVTDDPMHARTLGRTNVMKAVDQAFGDVDTAFGAADAVVEGEFDFPGLNHGFTEPHCVLAHWEADGRMTLWSPTQVPHYVHRALAAVLNLPMHQIRVIRTMIGGGFGARATRFRTR